MRSCFTYLAVILCISCASGINKDNVCKNPSSNLCDTVETKYTISSYFVDRESEVLRAFRNRPSLENIYGIYAHPSEALGGNSFYLFPDGSLAIDEWSDISLPPKLVATGTWTLEADIVKIHVTNLRKIWMAIGEYLDEDATLRTFVLRNGDQIGDTILVPTANLENWQFDSWGYLRRARFYNNWMNIKEDLYKRKINEEPEESDLFRMLIRPAPPLETY